MGDSVFEVRSQLAEPSNLYLDSMGDVKFIFGTAPDPIEIVPAHKCILSIGSPVFRTMFYGSLPEQNEIQITDTSPAVFKEFLKFFYMSNFHLTSDNIIGVTGLCKKYQMVEGLRLCEAPLQQSLTIDEMCSGYAYAIFLELENTIQFCEQKIIENAEAILRSASFLECNSSTLEKVLQLVIPKCSASVIVDASMAWATAKCDREHLEETPANLKAQLGQSFASIPFVELNAEEFEQFTTTYNDFLNSSDLVAVILRIKEKEKTSRMLECDRRNGIPVPFGRRTTFINTDQYSDFNSDSTFFHVNGPLLLTEIYCTRLRDDSIGNLRVSIYRDGNTELLGSTLLTPSTLEEGHAILEQSIPIQPQIRYEVTFSAEGQTISWASAQFKVTVEMRDGFEITFSNNGSVSRLVFRKT